MGNIIDFNKTVYEIYNNNPEIIEILMELGFKDIGNPGMLKTAGRFMTISKGAALKKIDIDLIKKTLGDKGYEIKE